MNQHTAFPKAVTATDKNEAALLNVAREIARRAGDRAADTERNRTVSPETIEELKVGGLLRVLQPRTWGGFEISNPCWLDIIIELAKECGSTAWVYSVLSAHATAIASFSKEAQSDVWGQDPTAVASSALAPTAVATAYESGFKISGKWSFSSGCDFAQWALAGAKSKKSDGSDGPPIFSLIPLAELQIEDDWNVLGLKGTGSKSLIAKEVFVPSARTIPFRHLLDGVSPSAREHEQAYFRSPRHAWAPSGLAAVGVGIALGFVSKFTAYAADRKILAGQTMVDLDTIQLKISESSAEAETARLILVNNTAEALAEVQQTGELTLVTRARNRRDQAFATRLSLSAVDRLYSAAGAYSLYDGNPLQSAFRDIHAVAGQIVLNFDAAGKSYPRVKLGLKPDDIFL